MSILLFIYTTRSFACEITTISAVVANSPENTQSIFEITRDCTEQNITDFYLTLSSEYQARFKNTLQIYFNQEHLSPVYKSKEDFLVKNFPNLFSNKISQIKTSVLALGASKIVKDPEQFNQIFGFTYPLTFKGMTPSFESALSSSQGSSFCCVAYTNHQDLTPMSASEIYGILDKGYSNLTAYQGSNLKDFGKSVVSNIKALFSAPPPDKVLQESLAQQKNAIIKEYERYKQALVDYATNLGVNTMSYKIASDLAMANTLESIQKTSQKAEEVLERMQNEIKASDAAYENIIAQVFPKEKILTVEEQRREDIKNGLYPKDSLNKIRDELNSKLMEASEQNPTAGISDLMDRLNSLNFVSTSKGEQLQNILNEHLDSRGIISTYTGFESDVYNKEFYTDFSNDQSLALILRSTINKSLAYKNLSSSASMQQKAQDALTTSLAGDDFNRLGMNELGRELIVSGMELLNYARNSPEKEYYQRTFLSASASREYDLDLTPDTFENYKIIQYANKFAANTAIQNDAYLKFYSNVLIEQNIDAASRGGNAFLSSQIDSELFLESVIKGVGAGITQFTVDTAAGIVHLVTSPIESIQAVTNALAHSDILISSITNSIKKVYNEFPNYSVEEKAKFITDATLNIVTAFVPSTYIGKAGFGAVEIQKLTSTAHEATRILTDYALKGFEGLERAESIAPGYKTLLSLTDESHFLNGAFELGNNLHNASPEFISGLMQYSQKNSISLKEMTAISRFEGGFSKFISEPVYTEFVLPENIIKFGKSPEHVTFATSRSAADRLIRESYTKGDKSVIRNAMGWTKSDWLFEESEKLYRVDIPFSFEYEPRLPTGSEVGANKHFLGTGFTPGNAPEMIIRDVPKNDIIGGHKTGFKIIYD